MLIYKGILNNIFKKGDYEDSKSGQLKVGKYQLEFVTQQEVLKGQGFQTVVEKISIPDTVYNKFKNEIGKTVEVNVNSMSYKNKVILYGVEA